MTKRAKFLSFLIGVSVVLAAYLVFTSKMVIVKPADKNIGASSQELTKVDLAELEYNYKQDAREIFREYEAVISSLEIAPGAYANSQTGDPSNSNSKEKLAQVKMKLLDLKVPDKYKDLHLNLILSISKMNSYIDNNNLEDKVSGAELINQAKKNNEWLSE